MANEFKVKKGLIVDGTNTVLDIQGTQGQLFSVTDSLSGDLFTVSDISGVPILNVNSSGLVTIDGSLSLGDSDKIQLGASQDLQIYHDGSNSYIADVGTGTLNISGSTIVNINAANGENGIQVIENAGVKLRHNNIAKLETTSTGVTVTGSINGDLTGNVTGDLTGNADTVTNGVYTTGTQTISGNKTFTGGSNVYNGHHYYSPYDSAGNHYPHFNDGSSASGTTINWRQYYGTSLKTHTWTSDSSGNMVFTFQGNINANGGNVTGSNLSGTNTGDQDLSSYLTASSTQNKYIRSDVADTAAELITFSKGISTDGNAKFYNWRALQNTSNTSNNYHKIAKITGTHSTRFTIELAGRTSSYSDTIIPSFGRLVGQLNNDNNYDLIYYDHTNGSNQVVAGIGQVDVSTTATDIWINSGQFSEITAIAHISDGTIIPYDTNSGRTGSPTGYIAAGSTEVWNSSNDGSGSGLDADTVDGIQGASFLRSDTADTATGAITIGAHLQFGNCTISKSGDNNHIHVTCPTALIPGSTTLANNTALGNSSYRWKTFHAGPGNFLGSVTASADVVAYSDIKLKENIKTLDGSKVLQMRGVSFDRKDNGASSSGVIAQEMQKVAPELVSDDDGTLGVAYGNITGYLIEAIKEQQKQINELKKLIKDGNNL